MGCWKLLKQSSTCCSKGIIISYGSNMLSLVIQHSLLPFKTLLTKNSYDLKFNGMSLSDKNSKRRWKKQCISTLHIMIWCKYTTIKHHQKHGTSLLFLANETTNISPQIRMLIRNRKTQTTSRSELIQSKNICSVFQCHYVSCITSSLYFCIFILGIFSFWEFISSPMEQYLYERVSHN